MFPIRDDIPSERTPVVNYTLIAACVIVYVMQSLAPDGGEEFIRKYGMIPARVVKNNGGPLIAKLPAAQQLPNGDIKVVHREEEMPALTIAPWLTVFTCMFLHGSLMHIVGNMWFLVIFGDNVEDRFGHVPFLAMYLASGLAAGLLQIVSSPASMIPTVGASGAIAGVMGAYLLLFPHSRVTAVVPLGVILHSVQLPGPVFLGIWFVFQLVSAAFSPPDVGGVAFWAHVGGFVAGLAVAWFGKQSGWLSGPRVQRSEF